MMSPSLWKMYWDVFPGPWMLGWCPLYMPLKNRSHMLLRRARAWVPLLRALGAHLRVVPDAVHR